MGFAKIELKLRIGYREDEIKHEIAKSLRIHQFTYQVENKSLDARKKRNIHWLMRVWVSSTELPGDETNDQKELIVKYKKRDKKILVVGSGPAGIFSALLLQNAGFDTTVIDRGSELGKRAEGIKAFESSGIFNPVSNYVFGEGGAGAFSDGKLTSRTKRISVERNYILKKYVGAGAPEEITYMAHPHIGSDNLRKIAKNLRRIFNNTGGRILFETFLEDLIIKNGSVKVALTSKGNIKADYFIIAPGHSSYETYRMLMKKGVMFRTKRFAIGSRVEHKQEIINKAQWGVSKLEGVKAAEYRLTSKKNNQQVYTFCMCPGGIVVPATAYKNTNIVNGMSYYNRNGEFANAACVVGIHPDQLANRKVTPSEALDVLEALEQKFYNVSGDYRAPACTVKDFLSEKLSFKYAETSYPLGINYTRLWELLPPVVATAMKDGLKDFCRKIKGYDTGMLLGLESKTSSPIQVLREESGLCEGFENLFIVGEGSGYAGGIVSSAVDGVKTAQAIV